MLRYNNSLFGKKEHSSMHHRTFDLNHYFSQFLNLIKMKQPECDCGKMKINIWGYKAAF